MKQTSRETRYRLPASCSTGDEDKPYIGYGLVVNAWMPLPKPYREEEEAAVDETTQKPDTGAERTDSIK